MAVESIRVLIADDHPLVREGLRGLIDTEPGMDLVGEATDGFRLAEIDFELRGPGDLLGTRQHGLPPMRIANLQHDQPTLLKARTDAQKLIAQDPELKEDQHARLRRMVFVRYGKELELGDVG